MKDTDVRHVTISVVYGQLTVHAAAHVDAYRGEQYSDMANRTVAALANAYEVLALTSRRLAEEHSSDARET